MSVRLKAQGTYPFIVLCPSESRSSVLILKAYYCQRHVGLFCAFCKGTFNGSVDCRVTSPFCRCQVGLEELPKNSALGRLRGSDNVVC